MPERSSHHDSMTTSEWTEELRCSQDIKQCKQQITWAHDEDLGERRLEELRFEVRLGCDGCVSHCWAMLPLNCVDVMPMSRQMHVSRGRSCEEARVTWKPDSKAQPSREESFANKGRRSQPQE